MLNASRMNTLRDKLEQPIAASSTPPEAPAPADESEKPESADAETGSVPSAKGRKLNK